MCFTSINCFTHHHRTIGWMLWSSCFMGRLCRLPVTYLAIQTRNLKSAPGLQWEHLLSSPSENPSPLCFFLSSLSSSVSLPLLPGPCCIAVALVTCLCLSPVRHKLHPGTRWTLSAQHQADSWISTETGLLSPLLVKWMPLGPPTLPHNFRLPRDSWFVSAMHSPREGSALI